MRSLHSPTGKQDLERQKSTFESKGILDVSFKSCKMGHKEIYIVVEKYSKLASRDRNCKKMQKMQKLYL